MRKLLGDTALSTLLVSFLELLFFARVDLFKEAPPVFLALVGVEYLLFVACVVEAKVGFLVVRASALTTNSACERHSAGLVPCLLDEREGVSPRVHVCGSPPDATKVELMSAFPGVTARPSRPPVRGGDRLCRLSS